jgi:carbonic anhydrase
MVRTQKSVAVTTGDDQALESLIDGNARHAENKSVHPRQTQPHRENLLIGQRPLTAILGCSDSRVPPEMIFDQGFGDLFVVRVPGNIVDNTTLASVEFAVHELQVPLIVVLGHTGCGAVKATISTETLPGHLFHITNHIDSAVQIARQQTGDLLENAVRINAQMAAVQLSSYSAVIEKAVYSKQLRIVAACYDLHTGIVKIIG